MNAVSSHGEGMRRPEMIRISVSSPREDPSWFNLLKAPTLDVVTFEIKLQHKF